MKRLRKKVRIRKRKQVLSNFSEARAAYDKFLARGKEILFKSPIAKQMYFYAIAPKSEREKMVEPWNMEELKDATK